MLTKLEQSQRVNALVAALVGKVSVRQPAYVLGRKKPLYDSLEFNLPGLRLNLPVGSRVNNFVAGQRKQDVGLDLMARSWAAGGGSFLSWMSHVRTGLGLLRMSCKRLARAQAMCFKNAFAIMSRTLASNRRKLKAQIVQLAGQKKLGNLSFATDMAF